MRPGSTALLALVFAVPAVADIYAFVDDQGVAHFTNVPGDDRYGVVLEEASRTGDLPLHPEFVRRSAEYDPLIRAAARAAGVDADLLRALIVVESGFDADAVSAAGAQGLMQLMPGTAELYGVHDAFDPEQNISGGARYLRDLLDRYDQDYELVLAAYNAGEEAVEKYGNRVPPFAETRAYVPKVLDLYNRLLAYTKT